jgi:propanol-preferring alcohol dehydrogenase
MRACLLRSPAPVESRPLELAELPIPEPSAGEVLIRVHACGVCRTDLHEVEGELPARKVPVTPGHQVVGVIERCGRQATMHAPGSRVGVAWLNWTDGQCEFCRAGQENLCVNARFTGYTVDGGYADFIVAPEAFVYPLPAGFSDLAAAPLLCAGIIGFRCLRVSGIARGGRLGFYGFGAAAHVAIQVARHWGVDVYVATRDERHQRLAAELGAVWTGGTLAEPPAKLDAAIIFAPAGEIVPAALRALRYGGTLVLGGIHMSDTPPLDYDLLYHERAVRSVANNTREDGHDFLRVAADIPVRIQVEVFPLEQANEALNRLKNDAIRGAGVLQISRNISE